MDEVNVAGLAREYEVEALNMIQRHGILPSFKAPCAVHGPPLLDLF